MMKRIQEGFFTKQQAQIQAKPIVNIEFMKNDLGLKLKKGKLLDATDWEFINGYMDGYVKVSGMAQLKKLIDIAIDAYGNNCSLNWIDVSEIRSFKKLFMMRQEFNCDISRWDMSRATSLDSMFYFCPSFNRDISGWDVSNVKDFQQMFLLCPLFEQDLSGWDTSSAKNMYAMFMGCGSFNSDLSGWNTSNVTNMGCMFMECNSFNADLSSWDIQKVQAANEMLVHSGIEDVQERWPKFPDMNILKNPFS